ncbi:lipopolysaccharide heptosyltransferase II [Flexistipes sp.]|uniref:lipopolysaccharide heptosyltransferase II n=1 Tax=Flexistipes sp. TaxID=3088135 RepID=UPI002E203131|nr:lipopolysaccharide heptosyltransferase II [Flexistipes sp.]
MHKILVFNPSFIGDSILTTPLVNALSKIYPGAKIYFCVRPESAGLFKCLENVQEVITFDKRGDYKGLTGLWKYARELRRYNFDMIVTAHKSFRSLLTLKLSGCENIIGFKQSSLSFLLDKKSDRNMKLHEVERNLSLLSNIWDEFTLEKAKKLGNNPVVCEEMEYKQKVSTFLNTLKKDNRRIIGIAPASVWETKRWPVENYATIIEKMYFKGVYSLVVSSPKEYWVIEELKEECCVPFLDFAGKTSLTELASIIGNLDLLISNDSAPMHIAAALEIPLVALFGPTIQSLGFFPYGSGPSEVVEIKDLYCRPCALHGGRRCPEKHFRCMRDIKPENVMAVAEELLK